MRQLAFVGLLVFLATTTRGQTPNSSPANLQCALSIAQSPEIRGIRLGMSAEKLLALFPEEAYHLAIEKAIKESKKADAYGLGRVALQRHGNEDNPKFSGVEYIGVDLLDEHVSAFDISYFGPQWSNVDQFITKLSEALRLPSREYWTPAGGPSKSLRCDGFAISAFSSGGSTQSSILVNDASAPKIVNDRREAAKEKVRQAFKP